jgi:hypothetical protein
MIFLTTYAIAAATPSAKAPTPSLLRCGKELYPVGTGYPLLNPRDQRDNANLVLSVARVVRQKTRNRAPVLLGYIYFLANGHHYYQYVPGLSLAADDRATERALLVADGMRSRASKSFLDNGILDSALPGSRPFPLGDKILKKLGLTIVPCTSLKGKRQ